MKQYWIELTEVVKRLEKAFPECDLVMVGRILLKDKEDRVPIRSAWEIRVAEKLVEDDKP